MTRYWLTVWSPYITHPFHIGQIYALYANSTVYNDIYMLFIARWTSYGRKTKHMYTMLCNKAVFISIIIHLLLCYCIYNDVYISSCIVVNYLDTNLFLYLLDLLSFNTLIANQASSCRPCFMFQKEKRDNSCLKLYL